MDAIQITADPCRCGGRGSVWHWAGWRYRRAYVECLRCGTRGPEVIFEDGSDEAEFVAVCRWNKLMYGSVA